MTQQTLRNLQNVKAAKIRQLNLSENEPSFTKKLIGYRGHWYDITTFIPHHPGGSVIEKFIGQDATCVIDSIHNYNVLANRKAVGVYQQNWGDFDRCIHELERKFRKEGLYDDCFHWYMRKCFATISILALNFFLAKCEILDANWLCMIASGILLGLFWQQSGMLMHDFMHNQVFGKRQWNEHFGIFFGTVCFGVSALWWKDEHIIHHALTNTIDYKTGFIDPQANEELWMQNELLFPFCKTRFKSLFVKMQQWTFLPLTIGLGRFGIMIDSFREETKPIIWLAWVIHWIWVGLFLSQFSHWHTALFVYWCGCLGEGVLHLQLLLNHYCKRFYTLPEKHSQEFHRTMIESNLNIISPWWMDWFHGGLNFHHEHHTFPRLPRNRLRQVSVLLKEACHRHKVFYDESSFTTALWRTLSNFKTVGKKFSQIYETKAASTIVFSSESFDNRF